MAESDFNELLHAAEQLSAEVDGSRELPKVERSLRQVLEASTELWSRVTQTGAQDLQAHVLLGSKGVDLPQLSQRLETLSTRKTFEPLEPVPEADVQTFLKNELENAILSIIEETNRTSFTNAEQRMWEDVNNRWRQEKMKALNSLLGASDEMVGITGHSEMSIITDRSRKMRSVLDDQQAAYAQCIMDYNTLAVQGSMRPSLIDRFKILFTTSNDPKTEDLWEMVAAMSNVPPQPVGDPLKARSTAAVEQAFIVQSRKYLERRYKDFMMSKVESHLAEARRGGQPGTLPLVLAFCKLSMVSAVPGLEENAVQGHPLWPVVYFCLRCGEPAVALAALKQGGGASEELVSLLMAGDDGANTHQLRQQLALQYQRSVRLGSDPFKKAVYCALAPCDVSEEHPLIMKTADDWLWLKLCQVRTHETLTFSHLQSLILEEYGEKHYSASSQPMLYTQMLLLTAQFEAAVEFLSRQERLRAHGVHVALALSELQLLALPPTPEAPLLSSLSDDKSPSRRINLARLLMLYVRRFEASDPKEALNYYYFLRNIKNSEGQNLFMLCVSDLVMEARNFDVVLGRLEADGCRNPGLIDVFQGVQAEPKQVIELVASEAERKGLLEDAVHLYDLAGKMEKVVRLLTSLLAQVAPLAATATPAVASVSGTGGGMAARDRLQTLASGVAQRLQAQGPGTVCPAHAAAAFLSLCQLLTFFDQYHAGEHLLALETITQAKLIPFSMSEMEERVSNFRRLSDEVCRSIPDVLLATMNILHCLYNWVKGGKSLLFGNLKDTSRDRQLAYLREKARCVTTFAGTVPYHMPGDTNSRLVQIEILMN